MKLDQERRLERHGEDSPLHDGRLGVVILDDDVLLEDLDGVQLVRILPFRQHYLTNEIIIGN